MGATGRGLKLVFSICDQLSVTHEGRGLKIILYTHGLPLVDAEDITFVNVGGFSDDVAKRINRSLSESRDSGKVIIVFGPEVFSSMAARAAAEVESKQAVERFAIVTKSANLQFLADLQPTHMPKLVGCFASPEEAMAASRISPENSTLAASLPPAAIKRRPRKLSPP
jgi:hypothetical protein